MSKILDHVAESYRKFRPQTPQEFFALQLTKKLADEAHLRNYLKMVERHPQQLLLRAFNRAVSGSKVRGALADRFHAELELLIHQEEQ